MTFPSPRFRIVQQPSYTDPTQPRFDIEAKTWWGWRLVSWEFNLEDAEKRVINIEDICENTVKTKVVKEYN